MTIPDVRDLGDGLQQLSWMDRPTALALGQPDTWHRGQPRPHLAAIRAWAAATGRHCPTHGPIPARLAAAYEAAHQRPP